MQVKIKSFGSHHEESYQEVWIENKDVTITFSDLGARINRWFIQRDDEVHHLILGATDATEAFEQESFYFGVTVLPVAGRITKGIVQTERLNLQLDQNNHGNHLHGGFHNASLTRFEMDVKQSNDHVKVIFKTKLDDGVGGYPGQRQFMIIHTYTCDNLWQVDYEFTSDQTTLFNPTNHVYFNLDDVRYKTIEDHHLQIQADYYLPVTEAGVPTGDIQSVTKTPFDFRQMKSMKTALEAGDDQIRLVDGIDHPFMIIDDQPQLTLQNANQNITMQISTTEPAVVIYTTNVVDEGDTVWGEKLHQHGGIAIETQVAPDATTHPNLDSIIYSADETYQSTTRYQLTYTH